MPYSGGVLFRFFIEPGDLLKEKRPIGPCGAAIGMKAQRFGGFAVGQCIVDEEGCLGIDARIVQYVFENLHVGLLFVDLVREIDPIEEIVHLVALITKTMPHGPLPVNGVRIAEEHHMIMVAQPEEKVELVGREIGQHGNPCGIYFGIRQLAFRHSPNAGAKGSRRDIARFELRQEFFLPIFVGSAAMNTVDAQPLECQPAGGTIQVDQYSAEIKQQVFYSFHHHAFSFSPTGGGDAVYGVPVYVCKPCIGGKRSRRTTLRTRQR